MRIVADTNVIVSALVFGGVPRRVLELADSGVCELFYSEAIQLEVRRVLVEKFVWSDAKVDEVLPGLWRMGELVIPRFKVNVVSDDADDNRILECALSASAIFIVSGDRHLLRLGRYKSMSIVSPREFLETCLDHGAD
jgi:putative PIN family toxin of toxin-antitoxin system